MRLGIGHTVPSLPDTIDWKNIQALALKHGLDAVVLDGIEMLPESKRPPKELTLQWIGEVLQNYEQRYELYCKAIAEMAKFYNTHHYKMMVLKGYACSLDWPNPNHRPCGDIDIWMFGQQKSADILLWEQKGIKVDDSHHHHTVYYWNDFMVENHYDFINIHHHRSHKALEKVLKEWGQEDTYCTKVLGETVFLPSPNLHALFLLKHLMLHFASGEINFRQLLDWAFFVKTQGCYVDWVLLSTVLDEHHMRDFFDIINAICVENLGFNARFFPYINNNTLMKDEVLKELFAPKFKGGMPVKMIPRILWKIRRWKANEWKHKLCYNESMWSAFWSGVWSHLIKPSSI